MPFATSEVVQSLQSDGRYQCQERHTDGQGVVWEVSYLADSIAESDTASAARFTNHAKSRRLYEIRRCTRHFADGGVWSGFTVEHFATKDKLKTRMLKLFRSRKYPPALPYARPVSKIAAPQIVSLLGVTTQVANDIRARANAVIDHRADDATWDDDLVDDDGLE